MGAPAPIPTAPEPLHGGSALQGATPQRRAASLARR